VPATPTRKVFGCGLSAVPRVDGSARICELIEYDLEDIKVRGAWAGPGSLQLNPHALAPVAELPVLEIVSAVPSSPI
jgi:acetoacetate decarboxylase